MSQTDIDALAWGLNNSIKLRLPDLPPLESTPVGDTVTVVGVMGSYWAAARYLRDEGGWVRVAWNGAFMSGFWVIWPEGATDAAEMAVDIPSPWEWSKVAKESEKATEPKRIFPGPCCQCGARGECFHRCSVCNYCNCPGCHGECRARPTAAKEPTE